MLDRNMRAAGDIDFSNFFKDLRCVDEKQPLSATSLNKIKSLSKDDVKNDGE